MSSSSSSSLLLLLLLLCCCCGSGFVFFCICYAVDTNALSFRVAAQSFTAGFLNQGGALVHVYLDGTVLVSHGGTEMGQGLHTKVCQVVANEFGIDVEKVRPAPLSDVVEFGTMLNFRHQRKAPQR